MLRGAIGLLSFSFHISVRIRFTCQDLSRDSAHGTNTRNQGTRLHFEDRCSCKLKRIWGDAIVNKSCIITIIVLQAWLSGTPSLVLARACQARCSLATPVRNAAPRPAARACQARCSQVGAPSGARQGRRLGACQALLVRHAAHGGAHGPFVGQPIGQAHSPRRDYNAPARAKPQLNMRGETEDRFHCKFYFFAVDDDPHGKWRSPPLRPPPRPRL